MHSFKPNDLVGYDSPDGYLYGRIEEVYDDEIFAWDVNEDDEEIWAPIDEVDYLADIIVDKETENKFARYEISAAELFGDADLIFRVRTRELHIFTVDELLSVIKKANGMDLNRFKEEWLTPVFGTLRFSYQFGHPLSIGDGNATVRYLPTEGYYTDKALRAIFQHIHDDDTDFTDIIDELEQYLLDQNKPITERAYDVKTKEHLLTEFDRQNLLDRASTTEVELYKRFTEDLCKLNNKIGLRAKAYSCYGGNRAYPCDWEASRDCLLALIEIDDDPFLANTLGYIYYYGRCTNGEPEHEKAFKYYSIGAAGGVYESRYKLADMFHHGYGTPKNDRIASGIIEELYYSNLKYICEGHFDTKFADIALRMGNYSKDGIGCEQDKDEAFMYYLQADYAIKMRMQKVDYYGDSKVAEGIRKAIDEILPETKYEDKKRTASFFTLDYVLQSALITGRILEMKIKRMKTGECKLTFRILPHKNEKYPPKIFLTVPEAHFCGLVDTITLKTEGCDKVKLNKRSNGDTAVVLFDEVVGRDLRYYGETVAEIDCFTFKMSFDEDAISKKYRFASVVFSDGGKEYDYLCDIEDVAPGDKVIVITDRGETEVGVVKVFMKTPYETALPIAKYKKVERKA